MLDLGWSEMLVIAVVAIVVIGPKDLPRTMRIVGRWIGKARAMAREFQNSLEDIAREAELDEIKKQINEVSDFNIRGEIEKSFDAPATEAGAGDSGAASALPEGGAKAATEEADAGASQAFENTQSIMGRTLNEASPQVPVRASHPAMLAMKQGLADQDANDLSTVPSKRWQITLATPEFLW